MVDWSSDQWRSEASQGGLGWLAGLLEMVAQMRDAGYWSGDYLVGLMTSSPL